MLIKPGKLLFPFARLHNQPRAIAVGHVGGGVDHGVEHEEARRVDEQMPLRAAQLLATVVAPRAASLGVVLAVCESMRAALVDGSRPVLGDAASREGRGVCIRSQVPSPCATP